MSLRTELEAAGLDVKVVDGWGTRGGSWAASKPVGVMQHHTAVPVPFPVTKLYGDLLKCNINTKPDGTVWLIAQKACNYSSGPGSSVVLAEVRAATPPTQNAKTRGLVDNTNGNPWFFNFENDHAGDGGPLPVVQLDAIVTATRVVLDHYGLTEGNVISHAEWTARKNDPNWNGSNRAIEAIRQALEDDMPSAEEIAQAVWAHMDWDPVLGGNTAGNKTDAATKLRHVRLGVKDIKVQVGALDSEGVSEAELDERVATLVAQINAQPAAFVAAVKAAL